MIAIIIPGETFSLFHFGAGTIKLEIAQKERKWMRKYFDTFDDVIEDGDEDVMDDERWLCWCDGLCWFQLVELGYVYFIFLLDIQT